MSALITLPPKTSSPTPTKVITSPKRRSQRTMIVAGTLLGLGAMLEFVAISWFLIHDIGGLNGISARRVASLPMNSAAATRLLKTNQSGKSAPDAPLAALALPTPVMATTPFISAVYQTSNAINESIEEAKKLRANGDMQTALARLRDASNISTDNPFILSEMALTYEAMQSPERAVVQWRRIFNMGPSIGTPYYLAEMRLKPKADEPMGNATVETNLENSSIEETSDSSTFASSPRVEKATALQTSQAIKGEFPADTVLRFNNVHLDDSNNDSKFAKKVVLRIEVKPKPGVEIDPREVKVEAYFYDIIGNRDLVLTDADTNYQWLTSSVNWANGTTEVLQTTYLRKKAPPATNPEEERIFAGYQVRVYYKNELQDSRAEPDRLLQLFPAPLSLPPVSSTE